MRRLVSLLLLLLLAACARPQLPVWTELPDADKLLQQVASQSGMVESLDAAASVSLNVDGKYFSSQQFVLLERPNRLRTDVLTGFGQLILQLTSDGEQLAVYTNTTVPGRFYRGPATDENLIRFTRIPLAGRDMVRLLLYDPPIIAYQQSEVLEGDGELTLRLSGDELEQELFFNEKLQLSGCRYLSKDKLLLEVLYQKIENERLFPQTVRIDAASEKTRVVIKFSDIKLNSEIPVERFRLQPPANLPVEELP